MLIKPFPKDFFKAKLFKKNLSATHLSSVPMALDSRIRVPLWQLLKNLFHPSRQLYYWHDFDFVCPTTFSSYNKIFTKEMSSTFTHPIRSINFFFSKLEFLIEFSFFRAKTKNFPSYHHVS